MDSFVIAVPGREGREFSKAKAGDVRPATTNAAINPLAILFLITTAILSTVLESDI
jgi:hypothetical protein